MHSFLFSKLDRHFVKVLNITYNFTYFKTNTAWKVSKYGVFSGPYFPAFGLNTGKYGPEKTPYLDTFHAVYYKKHWIMKLTVREKCPYSKILWSVFSRIWTEYGPQKLRIRTLFARSVKNSNYKFTPRNIKTEKWTQVNTAY